VPASLPEAVEVPVNLPEVVSVKHPEMWMVKGWMLWCLLHTLLPWFHVRWFCLFLWMKDHLRAATSGM